MSSAASADSSSEEEPPAKAPRLSGGGDAAAWAAATDKCIPCIVALRVTAVRAFENEGAGVSWGTGFVVDADRGLLLTNHHVAQAAPVRIMATFDQHEEVDVEVVYRDPLHDFAILRFDPSKLYLTRRASMELAPEELKVGVDVRVLGNDDGEKLQILQGTIARIDRNAPEYSGGVGDENTFYAGCGSNCSGGASGSPVVDVQGRALAMLAGGSNEAAADFFLPLDKVVRAVKLVQRGEPVPRGTIHVRFLFEPWAQLQRLGLQEEARDRLLEERGALKGLLVAERAGEGSPAQGQVLAGDVLLSLLVVDSGDAMPISDFVGLESALDDAVGKKVELTMLRGGERATAGPLPVEDLFALTPSSFLECGSGIFQDLSYTMARDLQLPVACGVLSAESGFIFGPKVPDQAVLTDVARRPVRSIKDMAAILPTLADGAYFEVRYLNKTKNATRRQCRLLKMQHLFAPLSIWRESRSAEGVLEWGQAEVPYSSAPADPGPPPAPSSGSTAGSGRQPRRGAALARVVFRTPCDLAADTILDRDESNGAKTVERAGVGFLAQPDLLVTDRHCVPQLLGDVEVTFDQEVTLQAQILFLHPELNLALLRIPRLPPDRFVAWPEGCSDHSEQAAPQPGDTLRFVGLDSFGHEVQRDVTIGTVSLPPPRAASNPPRFTERNCELLDLAEPLPTRWAGLLLDQAGGIVAFYTLFACAGSGGGRATRAAGIPSAAILRCLGRSPNATEVGVELEELTVAALRHERGFDRLEGAGSPSLSEWKLARPVVPCVARVDLCSPADGQLQEGDVLVRAGGGYVCGGAGDLTWAAPPGSEMRLDVFRDGAMTAVDIVPRQVGSDGCARFVIWHGLICVETPRALRRAGLVPQALRSQKDGPGVYAVRVCYGSPAQAAGLKSQVFVLEVAGQQVRKLDDLPAPTPPLKPGALGEDVRIRTVDHYGKEAMKTARPDALFWPLADLQRGEGGAWARSAGGVGAG